MTRCRSEVLCYFWPSLRRRNAETRSLAHLDLIEPIVRAIRKIERGREGSRSHIRRPILTRISTVCVLSGTLAVLALSADVASAGNVKVNVTVPNVKVRNGAGANGGTVGPGHPKVQPYPSTGLSIGETIKRPARGEPKHTEAEIAVRAARPRRTWLCSFFGGRAGITAF